jgi:hypothetical protein
MPLIDLKSDLTNLKFGNDRPGGGNSGLPYIKTYLPQNDFAAAQLGIDAGKYSIDFPIRGGAKAVTDAVTDTLRITRFFGDLQRGPFFIAKQIGLQLSNPRTEVGTVLGNTPYTQVYVPTNTLAQVGVQGSGIHWDRPGLVPSTPDQLKYAYVVGQQVVTNVSKSNRLLNLYTTKIKPGSTTIDPLVIKQLGIDDKSTLNLFKYSNGPETTYGIGETIIPRFESTTPASSSISAYPYLYGTRPGLAQVPNYKNFITASNAYMSQSGDIFSLGYVDAQGSSSLNNIGQQSDIVINNFSTNKYPTNFRLVTGSKPVLDYSKYTAAQSIFVSESRIQVVSGIEANGATFAATSQQKIVTKNNYESTPYPITYSGSYVRPAKATPTNEPGSALTAYKLYQSSSNPPTQVSRSKDILDNAGSTFFQNQSGLTFTYDLIKSRGDVAKNNRGQMPQDFRKVLIDNRIGANSLYSYDYRDAKVNMQGRIGFANSGMTNFDRSNTANSSSLTQDRVTMTPIQASSTRVLYGNSGPNGDSSARDLVKFVIEAVDNNSPSQTTKIYFRSYIDGFSDNHQANWNGFSYAGRGDTFYTYQGFTREVSMNFSLPALSRPEMKRIYQKANYLASLCYPNYNTAGLMRGNITLLTVGDYLYRTPGILKSVNITIPDDTAWEIAMNEPEGNAADSQMYELPQMLKISLAFTPIMSILPRRGAGVPLITPARKDNKFLGEVAAIV